MDDVWYCLHCGDRVSEEEARAFHGRGICSGTCRYCGGPTLPEMACTCARATDAQEILLNAQRAIHALWSALHR